jgi:hypothetical protein
MQKFMVVLVILLQLTDLEITMLLQTKSHGKR